MCVQYLCRLPRVYPLTHNYPRGGADGISIFLSLKCRMSAFEKENNDNDMDIVQDESCNSKGGDGARSQLPWVEKYRPNSLQDLIAHDEIISILNKLIESNKLPHLLFHGPPGMRFLHRCFKSWIVSIPYLHLDNYHSIQEREKPQR